MDWYVLTGNVVWLSMQMFPTYVLKKRDVATSVPFGFEWQNDMYFQISVFLKPFDIKNTQKKISIMSFWGLG